MSQIIDRLLNQPVIYEGPKAGEIVVSLNVNGKTYKQIISEKDIAKETRKFENIKANGLGQVVHATLSDFCSVKKNYRRGKVDRALVANKPDESARDLAIIKIAGYRILQRNPDKGAFKKCIGSSDYHLERDFEGKSKVASSNSDFSFGVHLSHSFIDRLLQFLRIRLKVELGGEAISVDLKDVYKKLGIENDPEAIIALKALFDSLTPDQLTGVAEDARKAREEHLMEKMNEFQLRAQA